jgi:hypothetical protein
MPMTNEERADHAGAAVAEYLSMKGEPHDLPAEEYEISDLICDLLHLGDRFGFNHQELIERALMHYEAENKEHQDGGCAGLCEAETPVNYPDGGKP